MTFTYQNNYVILHFNLCPTFHGPLFEGNYILLMVTEFCQLWYVVMLINITAKSVTCKTTWFFLAQKFFWIQSNLQSMIPQLQHRNMW